MGTRRHHEQIAAELCAAGDGTLLLKRGEDRAMLGLSEKASLLGLSHGGALFQAGAGGGLATLAGSDAAGKLVFVQPRP